MTKGESAKENFMSGLNCSQAVAAAFASEMNMPKSLVEKLTVGFGGGMGRMREVCGAVSGMTFVISALYDDDKSGIYKRVQAVANEFREENGSIVCRELLGLSKPGPDSPLAEPRTKNTIKSARARSLWSLPQIFLKNIFQIILIKNKKVLHFCFICVILSKTQKTCNHINALVAQLDRVTGYEPNSRFLYKRIFTIYKVFTRR